LGDDQKLKNWKIFLIDKIFDKLIKKIYTIFQFIFLVYFGGGYAVRFYCILRDCFGPSNHRKTTVFVNLTVFVA